MPPSCDIAVTRYGRVCRRCIPLHPFVFRYRVAAGTADLSGQPDDRSCQLHEVLSSGAWVLDGAPVLGQREHFAASSPHNDSGHDGRWHASRFLSSPSRPSTPRVHRSCLASTNQTLIWARSVCCPHDRKTTNSQKQAPDRPATRQHKRRSGIGHQGTDGMDAFSSDSRRFR